MKIISPKYDYCMKELFRNEVVRKYFISDILGLPPSEVRSARLLNTFLWKRAENQKQGILDVLVEMNDDTIINIEIQLKASKFWDRRQLYYLSKLYAGELRKGEDYSGLKRCVVIGILDFDLTGREQNHSVYFLRDGEGNLYSDVFEIHILELGKPLSGGPMDDWVRLFNVESEADLNMIKTDNIGVREAIRELRDMGLPRMLRAYKDARQKERMDRKAREDYVRDEGKAEGKAEDILELLAECGNIPEELRTEILSQKDLDILKKWHRLAFAVQDIPEFRNRMEE